MNALPTLPAMLAWALIPALMLGACQRADPRGDAPTSRRLSTAERQANEERAAEPARPAPRPNPQPTANPTPQEAAPAAEPLDEATLARLLDPPADEHAPEQFTVVLDTTKGEVRIDVTRAWAPLGADRIYSMVRLGYLSDTAFFRVIPRFMAQVGMHGSPEVNRVWSRRNLVDDPRTQSNTPGMVSFAQSSAPNSRSNQFFISLIDNSRLDGMGFAPFGRVRDMAVMNTIHSGYGESAPQGRGPTQGQTAAQGNRYLRASFPNLDYIRTARILEE